MNIYQLKKDYNINKSFREYYVEKIIKIRTKLESPKITQLDKMNVQSTVRNNDMSAEMATIVDLESKLGYVKQDIKAQEVLIEELEKILLEYNDINQLIYLEKELKGYKADKIAMKHYMDRSTVYRIINDIEDKFKTATK